MNTEALALALDIPFWQFEVALEQSISDDITVFGIEQATKLYRDTEGLDIRKKEIALFHWNRLCLEAAQKATTIEELRSIYSRSPNDEVTRGKILLRRIELTQSAEAIPAILGQTHCNIKVRYAAMEKWKDLTLAAITNTQTLTEAFAVYNAAPDFVIIKNAALMNCIQFIHTTADAKRICLKTNATSECREIALRHWLGLTRTEAELQEVYKHCYYHVDIRHETLLKIINLHER